MRLTACTLLLTLLLPCTAEDPAPPQFREVWLDTREVPALLGQGSWSMVPYREFAQLRVQAAEFDKRRRTPPWLTSLQLEARLQGSQLVGTARLQVRHTHQGSAWFNLQPWSPSLLPQTGTTSVASARSGAEPRSVLLRVDQPHQLLALPVLVEGEERPDGIWFTLQLPASPQSILTIDMPPGYRLDWPRQRGLMTGPLATDSEFRRFSLALDGSSATELTLVARKESSTISRPYQEARLDAEFLVSAKAVEAKFDLVVQRWHDRLHQLELELSSGLSFTQIDWKQGDNLIPLTAQPSQPGRWTITLPDQVDQRAALTLRTRWPVQPGQTITFHTPQVIHCNTRNTLRIQALNERLEHWAWGDYVPQERLDTLTATNTNSFSLTLLSAGLRTSAAWRSPSARLALRQGQQTFLQHASLLLGRSPLMTVHCQWSNSGKPELLQWKVPTGWKVESVQSGDRQPHPLWHWMPGKLLEVETVPSNRAEATHDLHISLTPEKPLVEKQPLILPHLVPQSTGEWSGTYALRLERVGTLLPPSLTIIKPPGSSISWKGADQLLPDVNWQLPDLQATLTTPGSIRLNPWSPLLHAVIQTELNESSSGAVVTYRLRLQPVAGHIVSWPLSWNAAMPSLVWRNLTSNQAVTWQSDSPQTGILQFPEGLTQPLELECQIPWDGTQPLPLLTTESTTALLKLPARWKPATLLKPGPQERTFRYDSSTSPVQLSRTQPSTLNLASQSLHAKAQGDIMVCRYEAELPAYEEPLQLSLPAEALLNQCTVSGRCLACCQQNITIPTSDTPQRLQLIYHLPLHAAHNLQTPRWSVPVNPPLTVTWEPDAHWLSLELAQMNYRLPLHAVLAGLLMAMALVRCISSRLMVWVPTGLFLLGLCVWCFPGRFLPAMVVLGALLILLLVPRAHRRPRLAFLVVGILMLLTPLGQAQPVRATVLVYFIAGKSNDINDALVIVPASVLTQLKNYVATEQSRDTSGWWVEQIAIQASRHNNAIRWTSTLQVRNQSADSAAMPWQQSVLPHELLVNSQPSQLRPGNVAFGLLQHSIIIPPRGLHEVKVSWTTPLSSETGWLTCPLRWPGCPVQTLTTLGLTGWLKTDTATIPLHDGSLTACGTVRESKLYLAEMPRNTISDAHADVAVHWEHRPQQSTMNVLVSYDFKNTTSDKLLLDLPRTVQLRTINLVGEKQALASPKVQRWQLTPQWDSQRLTIQLQRPVTGHVYLLLELLYERTSLTTIPLTGIEVLGLPMRQSFVAYSGDGVVLRLRDAGKPVPRSGTRFATAWLPSLASLPDEQFLRMQPLSVPAPALELSLTPLLPLLSTRSMMVMSEQQLDTTIELSLAANSPPATLLQGKVPADTAITNVTGTEVMHWQQSSPLADKTSELLIWLSPRSRTGARASCTITLRRAVSTSSVSVPLDTIAWQATLAHPELVNLQSSASVATWKLSQPMPELCGPWASASQLATVAIDKAANPSLLTWETAKALQPPSLTVSRVNSNEWKLMLQAAPGTMLPEEVQVLVKENTLQHLWQWDRPPAWLSRATATPEGILWTLRTRGGAAQLSATCFSTGATLPAISLPQWPAVKPIIVDR